MLKKKYRALLQHGKAWLLWHLSCICSGLMLFPPTQGRKLGVFICVTTQHVTLFYPKNCLPSETPPLPTRCCINHLIPSLYGKAIFSLIFSPVRGEWWFSQSPSGRALLLHPSLALGTFPSFPWKRFLLFFLCCSTSCPAAFQATDSGGTLLL